MASRLAIHVAPDANPQNVSQLVKLLAASNKTFTSVSDLLKFFADQQRIENPRTEIQLIASQMGLIVKSDEGIRISDTGWSFSHLKENVQGDILHFLMYAGWHESNPTQFLPSWTYRQCCDEYWQLATVEFASDYLDQQVNEIINRAESTFKALRVGDFDGVSFRRMSLRGVRKWLEALDPPVIQDNVFRRRDFCHPELLLLAIGFVMRDEVDALDVDILLSHDRREAICRVCLLDPAAFDATLDWMLPLFPHVISADEEVGYYGRYIRLHKRPTLEDVVR